MAFFEGFELDSADVGEATIRFRFGGTGPPLLLLHGHPRTHATWHKVAPSLADRHTVVCPDLRGYGGSSKPPTTPDHTPYSKRAMANDCIALMCSLGHERFAVAGHDRGCYVAFRLAMDHPEAVSHLAVLDGVPIGDALARCNANFASRWWHWFFFGQTSIPAERVINLDPDAWYGYGPEPMGAEAFADYQRAIHDPATVHSMCEDYRAGLTVDRQHDEEDREAGRRLACPVLVLWAGQDDLGEIYGDVLGVWRQWADDVRGREIDSGHHIAEEVPDELAAELREFLQRTGPA
jgi:haloacetate dehalogenase